MKLGPGFQRHCGPTAVVNVIRTLRKRIGYADQPQAPTGGRPDQPQAPKGGRPGQPQAPKGGRPGQTAVSKGDTPEELFLLCAGIGKKTLAYWNMEILGRFGGTSNFLTVVFLRRCLRAAGFDTAAGSGFAGGPGGNASGVHIRFHPWITEDGVAAALARGEIVYLEVYRHPKYKNHHMLCYACRPEKGRRLFLLADGWTSGPVWVGREGLGHGHYLTVSCGR